MKKMFLFIFSLFLISATIPAAEKGWKSIFDGKTLKGWKANERPGDWNVVDGAIHGRGSRTHLFYVAEQFKNFEFKADVKTEPHSNSGIYFHTQFQPSGWPSHGYECQVNISHSDPVKTGSIYNTCLVNKYQIKCKDNQWYTQHIIVKGKHIIIKIYPKTKKVSEINSNPFDEFTVVNFIEPPGVTGTRRLGKGLFALQQHDPGSKVYFKNIMVKKLPD